MILRDFAKALERQAFHVFNIEPQFFRVNNYFVVEILESAIELLAYKSKLQFISICYCHVNLSEQVYFTKQNQLAYITVSWVSIKYQDRLLVLALKSF